MIDLVLEVLVRSIFQFLISSNEERDGLTGTFLNNALSGGIEIGKEKIPAYLNSINRRVREEIRYSLERHCRGEAERERIILEFTELLRTVSSMPLSERPALFDRDSLHKSLMKLYEKNSSQVSDEENAVFSGVLYDLAPLLIREQAKLKGYAYELVLECFKHVLQIQAGTKDISLRLERMERLLEEEKLQPELPVQTFYRLWGQSVKAEFGNPESRLEKHRDLLSFLDDRLTKEMFDELCLDLPETSGGAGPPLAQFMCVGNRSRRPLFYAQTLVWFAKAWTERYGAERPDADRSCKKLSRTVESRQIEKHLNQAEASIKTARADSWIFLHMISEAAIQRVRQKNAITIR